MYYQSDSYPWLFLKRMIGLWLYIDYHVKHKYPVSIMSSNFELLKGAIIIAKTISRSIQFLRISNRDKWKTTSLTQDITITVWAKTFLSGLLWNLEKYGCLCTWDYIVIFSRCLEEYLQHGQTVLSLSVLTTVTMETCILMHMTHNQPNGIDISSSPMGHHAGVRTAWGGILGRRSTEYVRGKRYKDWWDCPLSWLASAFYRKTSLLFYVYKAFKVYKVWLFSYTGYLL